MFLKNYFIFFAFVLSVPVSAQTIEGKNLVKINFSSLAFKGFSLQYERQVSEKITIALGYGAIPYSSIPYQSYIRKQIFIRSANISDYYLSTSIFTPEVRYYFGKKGAFHGFYIAPYARISSYKIKGPISFSLVSGNKDDAIFDGKLKSVTGGIMVGSSWQLSAKFYFDWWIIGGSYGGESGKFIAPVQLSADDQASLRRTLESISLAGITLNSEVNSDGATVKTTGNMFGVRGLGLNIGFRF